MANGEKEDTQRMFLPWATIINSDASAAERKQAIRELFELQSQQSGLMLEERLESVSCALLAFMMLQADLLERFEQRFGGRN